MVQFFGAAIGFSVIIFAVLTLLGEAGLIFGGIFCVGMIFAGLYCVMDRLHQLEKKLDVLARHLTDSSLDNAPEPGGAAGPET